MSQQIGGYPPAATSGGPTDPPTTRVAQDEAADVGRTAADAGRQVAGTAADQAGNVVQEARVQARDLVGEARGQVRDQARTGQQKAADAVRTLSAELREMADGGQQSGPASEIARQAAQRGELLADWLGEREPADVLEEVRSFARRRPAAFLVGAALAGVVVGRLTRGAVDAARADTGPSALPARPAPAVGRGPAAPPRGLGDLPTPPRGTPAGAPAGVPSPAPRPYATPPVEPAPTGAGPDPYGADPYDQPGRHTLRGTGESGTTGDELFRSPDDDPYRPGGGPLR